MITQTTPGSRSTQATGKGLWPVAVFVHARPGPTSELLKTLKGSEGAGCVHLFVFADGPRHYKEAQYTEATQQIVEAALADHPFRKVTVVKSPHNRGLANSVISGVSHILDQYPNVIVIEDDLVISPATIAYLASALQYYENDPRVFSVTAFNYPEKVIHSVDLPQDHDNFFLHRPCSWAWGTWRRSWQDTPWDGEVYDDFLRSPDRQAQFTEACGRDVARMLRKQLAGQIDSWAIRFTYACFLKRGLVSYPNRSFVSNIGSRGDGTHKGNNSEWIENKFLSSDFDPAAFAVPELSLIQSQQFIRFTRRRFILRRLLVEARRVLGHFQKP